MPIDDGHKIAEPFFHRHIRDISSPDLVRPVDGQPFEQIGIDHMLLSWNAGSGFGGYADNPQRPHHGCRFFAASLDALAPKPGS